MRPATRYIHEFQEPDPLTGAVTVPITMTSTFQQDGVEKPRGGWEYGRTGNPSRKSLEGTIAAAENGGHGLCFASGSAATAAVLNLLQPGDEVLSTTDVYGGTWRLLQRVYARYGIVGRFLDAHSEEAFRAAITPKTRLIWIESPTNPLLNIIDIAAIAGIKGREIILAVDNTFASPYFQTPLDLGADIVVHSTTKYISGHSDVIGGALVTNREDLYESCRFYQHAAGGVPSPFDSFLVQRGLKTLAVRMERHQSNAFAVARALKGHAKVSAVHFPGFPDHPGHAAALRQMRGFPGMVSFSLKDGRPAVERFVSRLRVFTFAESLGGVESLACHPATMTHGAIPAADRERIGITEGLLRLSVGIEDEADLTEDIVQALG
ncbi:MAG: PLP-dependent transferase [Spirochaetia bacterium]|jgi:cystathionine beta-lyase/cystathionine gamma-synthase